MVFNLRKSWHLLQKRSGQIHGDGSLGKWLAATASDPVVSTIVEIGAWEGNGSTRVLREAVRGRFNEVSIVSLEASKPRFLRARRRNKRYPFVKLIWGTVISVDDLNTQDLTGDEGKWLENDVAALKNCPNVLHELPQSIDLLLLDGGEFSTLAEFQLLYSRVTKYLILDDTNTRKCRTIATNIRTGMTPFIPIVDSDDRNGFMVALKS